mgnify:CR=1 FL=1
MRILVVEDDELLRKHENHVTRLTLNRPQAFNALSGELLTALQHELDGVADVAIVGVAHPELGEEVKAVVQLMPGNYPTPGGYSMVNLAYLRWYEGVGGRSYDLPL